jgi:hypothetical protein
LPHENRASGFIDGNADEQPLCLIHLSARSS